MTDATCEKCPKYETSSEYDKTACIRNRCKPDEKLREDGQCEKCTNGGHGDQSTNYTTCHVKNCSTRQRIDDEGYCRNCPDYMVHGQDKLKCELKVCGMRQKVGPEAQCI